MAPEQQSGMRGGQYRFGEFTLDTARGELLSGSGPVRLRPQSYEVLLLLVTHAGELLSKDFIHERIWANRAVTDDSLTQCLIEIRRAIGDTDRSVVRTVPRRGYMFTGEVENPAASVSATTAKRIPLAVLVAAGLLAVALVGWFLSRHPPHAPATLSNSVAVLPFVDRSAAQDQQYLGDGLSEDILSRLGHVPELQVIARTSSFALAEASPDVASLRDQLRVAYVVEGSVGREGDQIRVTARLIETENSTNVWTQTFEVTRGQLGTVQEAIATAILGRILPGQGTEVTSPAPRIGSVSEAMLLGRHYESEIRNRQEVDSAMLGRAIELYRDVVEADPDSALAHSRLASVLLWQGDIAAASDQVFRALTLDPDLSEVLEVLGRYYWATNLMEEAGDAWRKAMALNPSNIDALSHFATYAFRTGDYVVAEELYRRAVQLDPLNLSRYADLGHLLAVQEKTAQTEAMIQEVQSRFDGPDAYTVIAHLLDYLGRLDESIAWIAAARDSEPDDELHVEYLAELLVDIGNVDAALAVRPEPGVGVLLKMRRYDDVIDEAELLMIDEPDDIRLRYVLAFAYNAADRPEDALRIYAGLDSLGPEFHGVRLTSDLEARVAAADALFANGEVERARTLVGTLFQQGRHDELGNWWRPLYSGCTLSILGREDDALESLQRVAESPRLPWAYLLRDMHCFRALAGRGEYQQVLQRIEVRQADLQRRLPQTLQAFGVSL